MFNSIKKLTSTLNKIFIKNLSKDHGRSVEYLTQLILGGGINGRLEHFLVFREQGQDELRADNLPANE